MIINHPHLGPRDASEFTILGDASLINRPDWQAGDADDAFYTYQYLRDNPAGLHRELWFHEQGDRSWLVVTRDTVTHAVIAVALASDVAKAAKAKQHKKPPPKRWPHKRLLLKRPLLKRLWTKRLLLKRLRPRGTQHECGKPIAKKPDHWRAC
jgi:sarcosine oxidase subunit delta